MSVMETAALLTADERTALEGFLDHYRDVMVRKVRGVSEQDARKHLVPSATTLGGLLKHLRWVEHWWFELTLPRVPFAPKSPEERTREFGMEPNETLDELVAAYQEQCASSRAIAAEYQLDDLGHRDGQDMSLRWIYLHMIEETARHAGHIDILREQIDGTTGD